MERTVLYVDPDADARDRFGAAIEAIDGLGPRTAQGLKDATEILEDERIDVIVSEATIGTEQLDELFSRVRDLDSSVPCIIFTDDDISDLVDTGLLTRASTIRSKDGTDAFEQLAAEIGEIVSPRSEIDYPVPEDEDKRVRAAESLDLDHLRDRTGFDRLTRLARKLFDVRYAFVGIVRSDTEEFISFEGGDEDRLRRECTICTFGILDGDATIIGDRRIDERFKYIDELDELEIVFYAGYPLVDDDGHRVGMFCVMDDEPRTFSEQDQQDLRLFAEQAMELVQLYGGDA